MLQMLKIGFGPSTNIIDYVTRERETFQSRAFTAVDSLVLSQLSYLHLDGIVPDSIREIPVTIQEIACCGMKRPMSHTGERTPPLSAGKKTLIWHL